MKVETILCALDGSDHSDKAVGLAADLAARYGARLYFVHVLMRDLTFADLGKFDGNAHLADVVEAEQKALADLMVSGQVAFVPGASNAVIHQLAEIVTVDAKAEAERLGVDSVDVAILDGKPDQEIVSFADQVAADLIVIGTRGLSGVKDILLGSVSQKVLNRAGCTCVCVK